jgi:O-antigen/teichoic acid export membrane protein
MPSSSNTLIGLHNEVQPLTFYGSAVVVVYLVPALLLANMYIFAPGIGIAKRTHYLIWINTGGALLNGGLNYVLIPILGIVGAALATMLNYLAVFTAYMVLSQRLYRVPHRWRSISAAVLIAALIAALLPQWSLPDADRWFTNALALIGFVLFALGLGLIKRDEISLGWRLVTKRVLL